MPGIDWPHTPEEMLDRLMKHARAGAILLLHDGLVRLHGSEAPRTHNVDRTDSIS